MYTPPATAEQVINIGNTFECHFNGTSDYNDFAFTSSANWTSEQINCATRALTYWDNAINNEPGRAISVGFFWANSGGLAASESRWNTDIYGNYLTNSKGNITTVTESIWRDGATSVIDDDWMYDIYVFCSYTNMNSFYYGEAPMSSSGNTWKYDFETILIHEMGHAVGFASANSSDATKGNQSAFDALMFNETTGKDAKYGISPGDEISLEGSDLTVYNPSTWQNGSSLTHIDIADIGGQSSDILMRNVIDNDLSVRGLSYEEMLVLQSMGWDMNFAMVPEPSTATLSLLTLAGLMLRRKRD